MKVACLYFTEKISLRPVAEVFLRLSPQISLGRSALFIEIEKCRRLYSEKGFLARCQVLLGRLQLSAQIAIAGDIAEAFVMAKHQCSAIDLLPLIALVDLADPFEKDLLLQENVLKMIQSFKNLGVHSIEQFRLIPLPELVSRFGAISVLCMQKLRHEVATPWTFFRPEEIIFEKDYFPFFEFYGELEPLLFKLKEQLDRIFQRLWARQLRIQKMHVRIFCETNSVNPHPFRHFDFEFVSPQSTTKATLNILKERLSQDFQKNPVRTPIEALETKILITVPGNVAQKNLLHNHEEQNEQLQALLAQLGEAHGISNIFHAELTEDRRPEKSWRKIRPHEVEKKLDLHGKIPLRPTRLLSVPIKVLVRDAHLYIQGRKFKIVLWSPFPERICGDWFEDTSLVKKSYARNYFQVELERAPAVSLYQEQDQSPEFYLHGYYG